MIIQNDNSVSGSESTEYEAQCLAAVTTSAAVALDDTFFSPTVSHFFQTKLLFPQTPLSFPPTQ